MISASFGGDPMFVESASLVGDPMLVESASLVGDPMLVDILGYPYPQSTGCHYLNSFGAKLAKIAYCYSAKYLSIIASFQFKMVTIVDFGAFHGRRLWRQKSLKLAHLYIYFFESLVFSCKFLKLHDTFSVCTLLASHMHSRLIV